MVVGAARLALSSLALAAGCGDAVLVAVDGDLPIGPTGVDAVCLAVADRDLGGGHVARQLALTELPQSLRVEPGAADAARAWVVGYRSGVPVARDAAAIDFGGDVTLRLDRCDPGASGAPTARGAAVGPAGAAIAVLHERDGERVVAVAAGAASVIDVAAGGELVAAPAPSPPVGAVRGLVAFDLDGDCDDDLAVITDGAAPALWRAEGATLEPAGAIGAAVVRAATAADIDRDGDVDVITAAGDALAVWRNDGAGRFVADPAAITGAGFVTDAVAVAAGDLDDDGSVDLVVGQAAGPLRAFAGDRGAGGLFTGAPGVFGDASVPVAALRLADADGDGDPDLWVAVAGGPARLYIDRVGTLEDLSFQRLPQPAPTVTAIAVGGWDADCTVDAVAVGPAGGALWRGDGTGALIADGAAAAATAAELVDLDDDGDLDLALATSGGVAWLAR